MPSGYDEYEGIFGPLGAASAGHRRNKQRGFLSQTHLPSSSAPAPGFRRRQASHTRSRSYAKPNARAFLAQRQAKRQSHMALDEEDEHLPTSTLTAPPPERLRRPTAAAGDSVWLPSREFSFRQRAGKLDTRTLARVDLAQVVATTDVDTIQEHLENLAFADVTLEDVQQFSDAYFLKLFQIAQLTLEYLMHVQDSLVGHADDLETQCAQLVQEAQTLERENDKFETEISSLKSEVRHKQRTMATLEMLLLNTRGARLPAAAGRREKENAGGDANQQLVDELLGQNGDQEEAGAIGKPVACVLCGKKFLSAEYLIRHQERKHKKRSSSSASESQESVDEDGGSRRRKKKGKAKDPALPVKALEEKNELAKQLLALQEQLQKEKEARSLETKQLETHHSQLTANMVQSMSKLQSTLADMESKHEQAKREMMLYTRETMLQMQQEAAAAAARAAQTPKPRSSHVGQLESDEDESGGRTKPSSKADASAAWTDKMEKLMDTFLRAQAQKQQEVDELAHENAKLRTKQRKLHKRRTRTGDEVPTLVQMAALEAQRFGFDRGEQSDANMSVQSYTQTIKLQLDDKTVQTDEEADKPIEKARPRVFSQEVQTEEGRPPAVVEKPASKIPVLVQRKETPKPAPVECQPSLKIVNEPKAEPKAEDKPAPVPAKEEIVLKEIEKPPAPVQSADAKLQHAAHVVGKVALGFLTRKTLVKAENWLISLPLSSLLSALSDEEFARVAAVSKAKHQSDVRVKVEKDMTANALRVAVAQALSEGPEGESDHESIEYHRVLLRHEDTGEELIGDRSIETFRNRIAVEIIPRVGETESYMADVLSSHAEATSRLAEIKRQAMAIDPGALSMGSGDSTKLSIMRVVRLQARVRSFLARRQMQRLRIDRLVEARVAHMRAISLAARRKSIAVASDSVPSDPLDTAFGGGVGASDPLVARHVRRVQDRVGALVQQKTGMSSSSRTMSTKDFETNVAALEQQRKQLPTEVQTRIQQLLERVNSIVQTEYDPEQAKTKEQQQTRAIAATKIQYAMRIAMARKRLQTLLQRSSPSDSPVEINEDPRTSSSSVKEPSVSPLSSSNGSSASLHQEKSVEAAAPDKKDEETFDQLEIEELANAYEEGLTTHHEEEEEEEEKPMEKRDTPRHSRESSSMSLPMPEAEAKAVAAQPGRSPRPTMDSKVISPFSSTKLISRRAALNRSGSGFANAR